MRGYLSLWPEQARTYYSIVQIKAQMNDYKKQHGNYPVSLSGFNYFGSEEKNGRLLDGWKRPFEYSISGVNYFFVSRGRDGLAGGVGLDCDLSNLQPHPAQARLTLPQFLFDSGTRGIILSCIGGGLFACFALLGAYVKPSDETRKIHWLESTFSVMLTIMFSIFIAAFMALMHIPSGH